MAARKSVFVRYIQGGIPTNSQKVQSIAHRMGTWTVTEMDGSETKLQDVHVVLQYNSVKTIIYDIIFPRRPNPTSQPMPASPAGQGFAFRTSSPRRGEVFSEYYTAEIGSTIEACKSDGVEATLAPLKQLYTQNKSSFIEELFSFCRNYYRIRGWSGRYEDILAELRKKSVTLNDAEFIPVIAEIMEVCVDAMNAMSVSVSPKAKKASAYPYRLLNETKGQKEAFDAYHKALNDDRMIHAIKAGIENGASTEQLLEYYETDVDPNTGRRKKYLEEITRNLIAFHTMYYKIYSSKQKLVDESYGDALAFMNILAQRHARDPSLRRIVEFNVRRHQTPYRLAERYESRAQGHVFEALHKSHFDAKLFNEINDAAMRVNAGKELAVRPAAYAQIVAQFPMTPLLLRLLVFHSRYYGSFSGKSENKLCEPRYAPGLLCLNAFVLKYATLVNREATMVSALPQATLRPGVVRRRY